VEKTEKECFSDLNQHSEGEIQGYLSYLIQILQMRGLFFGVFNKPADDTFYSILSES
jgi:hypothetical protein